MNTKVAQSKLGNNGLGRPRDPFKRHPVTVSCDPEEGRTHQSFAQECDVNYILDQFGRTGQLPNAETREPQYGDVPEIDFHEAMVAKAEIDSAIHDGFQPSPEEPEAPEEPVTGSDTETPEKALEEPSGAPETATEG